MNEPKNEPNQTPEVEDFLTEPLVGLLPHGRPMTEEERRAHVVNLHQMRQNYQAYRQAMEQQKSEPKSEPKGLKGFEEMF